MKTIKAIVLHALPFQDNRTILTLFSREEGSIKTITKRSKHSLGGSHTADPLTEVEATLREGRGELWQCDHLSIVQQNMALRQNYQTLQAAWTMVDSLFKSQMTEKPAPLLYDLLKSYLSHLPSQKNPANFSYSFQLKLLRHEGVLHPNRCCSACQLPGSAIALGESFCATHAPSNSLLFSPEEWSLLSLLALSRSYEAIGAQTIQDPLCRKIEHLFRLL